jgi:DHA1 family multidrug resistance protein-like MFS transporter
VSTDLHGLNLEQWGVKSFTLPIGVIILVMACLAYSYYYVNQCICAHGFGAAEVRLVPVLLFSFIVQTGLFNLAWTSRLSIHCAIPLIDLVVNNARVFIVFLCIFVYIPLSSMQYAGSVFAVNNFTPSVLSFAAILFLTPTFHRLAVDRGLRYWQPL